MPVLECLSPVSASSPLPGGLLLLPPNPSLLLSPVLVGFPLLPPFGFPTEALLSMPAFLSTSTVCPHIPEPGSHITSSHALLFAHPPSPYIPPLFFAFYFPRHLFLVLPSLSYIPPTVTIKLLVAIPRPLYKKKTLHIISALSFFPAAAAVVFFLAAVFSPASKHYITKQALKHVLLLDQNAFLFHAPLGLCRGSSCPQYHVVFFHPRSTCCACGRGWLVERAAVLQRGSGCFSRITAVLPLGFLI